MASGLEPYEASALMRLVERHGAAQRPSNGGARRVFDLPNGAVVVCPNVGPVPTPVARQAARSLGMSWAEFRTGVGHPVLKSGRSKASPSTNTRQGCTKRDVFDRIAELRSALVDIERDVKPGIRDSSSYMRVHEQLVEALVLVRRAYEMSSRKGVA